MSKLYGAAELRQLFETQNSRPNRALGQNFLVNAAARDAIIDAAKIDGRPVLEIGPGLGALTEPLAKRAACVVAVEKDAQMVRLLKERVVHPNLTVVNADFLNVDLQKLFEGGEAEVVANLPYYVTTPIVMRLLTANIRIPSMTLMLQQEAAQRFFAAPGEKIYTPLTVLSALGYRIRKLMELSPADYWPQPDVYSAVVRLEKTEAAVPDEFLPFLNAAFSMRRKTLANNLLSRGVAREDCTAALSELGLAPNARAEQLEPRSLLAFYERIRLLTD